MMQSWKRVILAHQLYRQKLDQNSMCEVNEQTNEHHKNKYIDNISYMQVFCYNSVNLSYLSRHCTVLDCLCHSGVSLPNWELEACLLIWWSLIRFLTTVENEPSIIVLWLGGSIWFLSHTFCLKTHQITGMLLESEGWNIPAEGWNLHQIELHNATGLRAKKTKECLIYVLMCTFMCNCIKRIRNYIYTILSV